MRPSTISAGAIGAIAATVLLAAAWALGGDHPQRMMPTGCPTVTVHPL